MNDKTNFDEYTVAIAPDINGKVSRTVGLETIIPAIRSYIHENEGYSVEVTDGSETIVFDIQEQNKDGHITETQLADYCNEKLDKILKKYNNKNVSFKETYREEEYSGGMVELDDGETIEKVNTKTKVKITYTKI